MYNQNPIKKNMNKELLKKAFEAGRDYQYSINPYSGKPTDDKVLSFTKWYNKLIKEDFNK